MSNAERAEQSRREVVDEEAFGWVITLRRENSPELRAEFDEWRKRSPDHQRAFDWASGHFDGAEALKASARYGIGRVRSRRAWMIGTALLVAASGVAVMTTLNVRDLDTRRVTASQATLLAAERGQIRTFRLADGSQVTLDSGSRATVMLSKVDRRMTLNGGRARVLVAPEERPFLIAAGAGVVRTREAVLELERMPNEVRVELTSGRADMTATVQPAVYTGEPLALTPNEPVQYPVTAFRPEPGEEPAVATGDWTSGWLEYRSIALKSLVIEANRYANVPVIVDDERIANLAFSGRVRVIDTEAFVSRIAQLFDLKVVRKPDGVHLRAR